MPVSGVVLHVDWQRLWGTVSALPPCRKLRTNSHSSVCTCQLPCSGIVGVHMCAGRVWCCYAQHLLLLAVCVRGGSSLLLGWPTHAVSIESGFLDDLHRANVADSLKDVVRILEDAPHLNQVQVAGCRILSRSENT